MQLSTNEAFKNSGYYLRKAPTKQTKTYNTDKWCNDNRTEKPVGKKKGMWFLHHRK